MLDTASVVSGFTSPSTGVETHELDSHRRRIDKPLARVVIVNVYGKRLRVTEPVDARRDE